MGLFERLWQRKPVGCSIVPPGVDVPPLEKVYDLAEELARNPDHVADAQLLTQDPLRPAMGLRGSLGLFGSEAWWENVRSGKMPIKRRRGIIVRTFVEGMESGLRDNAVEVRTETGDTFKEGIYANTQGEAALYGTGKTVEFVYALDERKRPDRSVHRYLEIVVEAHVGWV